MSRTTRPRPEGYVPLSLAPESARGRYARRAAGAHREPMAAIKLKCLDCSGWTYREAKECQIRSCPLWALNRWIFTRHDGSGQGGP